MLVTDPRQLELIGYLLEMNGKPVGDCSDVQSLITDADSGIYSAPVNISGRNYGYSQVFCDMDTANGGWTVSAFNFGFRFCLVSEKWLLVPIISIDFTCSV